MRISVIIPAYNASETIEKCIQSLLPQISAYKDTEVIVINSSDDETPRIIQQYSPQVKLIQLEQRAYPGTARNIGINQAQGEIIVTIDADCIAQDNFLEQIIQVHQSEAIAIGGATLNGHPESITSWAEYFSEYSEYLEKSPKRFVKTIGTGNMSYKCQVFSKYGFFPDISRGEDVIFHHRLIQNGEKILFDPSIVVYHLFRTQLRNLLLREIHCNIIRRQVSRMDAMKFRQIIYLPPFFLLYPAVKLFLIIKRILCWDRRLLSIFLKALPRLILILLVATLGMLLSFFYGHRRTDGN